MKSGTLYHSLISAGLQLSVDQGQLCVGPVSHLTDAHRALLRQHKPELVKFLLESSGTNRREVAAPDCLAVSELELLLGFEVEVIDLESAAADDWDKLHEHDRECLSHPVERSPPCRWCGAWNFHSKLCFSLHINGPFVVRWGKYRGQPLATLPREYLQWLTRTTKSELTPDWRSEIHRLLHAGKHDYQAVGCKGKGE